MENRLKKLGTAEIDIVETTPVVFGGRLYVFEWYRNFSAENKIGVNKGCYRFMDVETKEYTPCFAHGHTFGSAFTENGKMYVFATDDWGSDKIEIFVSDNLTDWEIKSVFYLPEGWKMYNTSVCRGENGYVMAIEISDPPELTGHPFTNVFAVSDDLLNWELYKPETCVHTKDRYSACPVIRYVGGCYYMIYLEGIPLSKYVPYIARSKDLENWEVAEKNPVFFYSDEDKLLWREFDEKEKAKIEKALNINNSDVDLCEYKGKTFITYSWGNQHGTEFLAFAEYDGSLKEFFEAYFN